MAGREKTWQQASQGDWQRAPVALRQIPFLFTQAGKSMKQRIRVLIADDRPRSRNGLRAVLAVRPEIEIVGEVADGREALRLVEEYQPDVVLMDVWMPVLDGLEATRLIKSRWPEVKVIVLTMYTLYRADAMAAGADGFLVKGCPTQDLLEAISGDLAQTASCQQGPHRKSEREVGGSVLQAVPACCTP